MRCNLVILMLLVLATPNPVWSSTPSPASDLCRHGGGATRSAIAQGLISFHAAIQDDEVGANLRDQHLECVAVRLNNVESEVAAYCDARTKLGHDLAAYPLWLLDSALDALYYECDEIRWEDDRTLHEEMTPKTCDELVGSMKAFAELNRSKRQPDANYADCIELNVADLAGPVRDLCADGKISVRASYTELSERLSKVCEPTK